MSREMIVQIQICPKLTQGSQKSLRIFLRVAKGETPKSNIEKKATQNIQIGSMGLEYLPTSGLNLWVFM